MSYLRSKVVAQAKAWIGCKESDGSHKEIIDVYNSHTPLARGYKVQYTDAWCATFVSAVAIKCGYTDIMPTECGCDKMIALYQNLGRWKEDDSYTPDAGDVIFYDWQDSGSGDNTGSSDHVGIVEKVVGTTITVIEGNYSDSVKRRTLQVNGKYIRGFGLPKYTGSSSTTTTTTATKTVEEVAKEVIAGEWGNGNARKTALEAAGYSYTEVQAKVNELLKSSSSTTSTSTKAAATSTAEPKTIWDYLLGKIGNAFGVAGLMGNLYAESALIPNNLQNSYQSKLGYTDASYTAAVDDGSYSNFSSDSAGYGLAQWTYSTRKKALKEYADSQNASIGNLEMQLGFLYKELSESYSSVLKVLKNASSVSEASNAVLLKYEKPANTGGSVQEKRTEYGQTYYDKYAGSSTSSSSSSSGTSTSSTSTTEKTATDKAQSFLKSLAGTYKVTATNGLNVRNGAGTSKSKLVTIPYETEVKNYGYYTTASGVKWLYIQFTYKNVKYTGFASSQYLKKS